MLHFCLQQAIQQIRITTSLVNVHPCSFHTRMVGLSLKTHRWHYTRYWKHATC